MSHTSNSHGGPRSRLAVCVSVLLAGAFLGFVHCGEDSYSLDQYVEETATVYCSYYSKCCSNSEGPMKGRTESECQALLVKQQKEAIASTPGYEWDPEGKAGCLTILRKLEDCRPHSPVVTELGWKSECRPPGADLAGASGDKCTDVGTLCQPGLLCLYTPGQTREGTCQAPRAEGDACSGDYECASGICYAGACASSGPYPCDGK